MLTNPMLIDWPGSRRDCVLLVLLLFGIPNFTQATFQIHTSEDLRHALLSPNITKACLANDLSISDQVLLRGEDSLLVKHNITITSCAPDAAPLLDFGYKQGTVRLQPNVILTLDSIILKDVRARSGYALDIFLSSPGAAVVANSTIRWLAACVQATPSVIQQALSQPRARGYPGTQDVRRVDKQLCIRDKCFSDYMLFVNYTASNLVPFAEGSDEGGYDLLRFNDTRVCDAYVTQQCIQDRGADACLLDLISQRTQGNTGGVNTILVVQILVPVAVVAVLACLLVGYLFRQKRRMIRQMQKFPSDGDEEWGEESDAERWRQRDQRSSSSGSGAKAHSSQASSTEHSERTLAMLPSMAGLHFIRGTYNGAALTADSMPDVQLGLIIGAGSFGKVYRATLAGQPVAVKVLEYDLRMASRVQNELDCATFLSHPNVVGAYATVTFGSAAAEAQLHSCTSSYRGSLRDSAYSSGAQRRQGSSSRSGLPSIPQANSSNPQQASSRSSQQRGSSSGRGFQGSSKQRGSTPTTSSSSQQSAPPVQPPPPAAVATPTAASLSNPAQHPSSSQAGYLSSSHLSSSIPTSPTEAIPSALPELCQLQLTSMRRTIADAYPSGESTIDLVAPRNLVTWIVMDYCDKGSLSNIASRMGEEPMADKLPFLLARLLDVARGMAYVHSRGICHGDLKACNVLVASARAAPYGCSAKVSDFGLSRALALGASHLSTRTYGTVTHMAPELLASGHMRQASDVYSFGIMMYEVLTGKRHYSGMMHGEIIHKVIIEHKRPEMPACIPPELAALAADCWQHSPEARPSFEQVAARLEGLVARSEQLAQQAEGAEEICVVDF